MRLAVCISGQVRNADATLPPLAKLVREIGAEVFISTWNQPGTKVSGFQGPWHVQRMFGPVFTRFLPQPILGSGGIPQAVPHFESLVAQEVARSSRPMTIEYLTEVFNGARVHVEDAELLDFGFTTMSSDNNSLRMLYKIWRANEMKRLRESQSGTQFDAVIRLRSDVLPHPILLETLHEIAAPASRVMYVDDILPQIIGDKLAMSSSVHADYYAALFGKALRAPARPWRGIHHELHEHLGEAGLEARLHRVQWRADSDADQQAVNRRILLEQLAGGQVAPWVFASGELAACAQQVLRAADLLEAGDAAAANDVVLPLLENPTTPAAMLADVLAIAAEIGARHGALGDAYVAMLLSWVWRAKDGNPIISTCEVHLPTSLKTMTDAVDPARKASAFAWSTADSMLSGQRGAGALARLAGAARHGDLRAAAIAALDGLRTCYAGSPEHAEALIAEGMDRLHKAGDPEGAAVVAWSLVASVPANWRGHDLLGHCSERLGDPEAALRHALAALECSPSHGGLQARVGCVLMYLLSRPADAEPYLRNGTRLWPDARAWHWHAEALARINRVPEALVAIEEALHRVPANPAYRALKNRLLSASVPPAADLADGRAI